MEQVLIRVPASPVYARVVRLVTSGLASRLRFTIDDIEDLKIAVDELCGYLTGPHGRDGTLQIRFVVADDGIEIRGSGEFADGDTIRTDLSDFSRVILETVVDQATLERVDGVPSFYVVKKKATV